jgi:hypothetical protein
MIERYSEKMQMGGESMKTMGGWHGITPGLGKGYLIIDYIESW